jgi:hypothetical protein
LRFGLPCWLRSFCFGFDMPTYRVTIDRAVRFQLDFEAATRLDALRMVTDMALMYDDRDLKETRVIAIKELKEDAVLNSPD